MLWLSRVVLFQWLEIFGGHYKMGSYKLSRRPPGRYKTKGGALLLTPLYTHAFEIHVYYTRVAVYIDAQQRHDDSATLCVSV